MRGFARQAAELAESNDVGHETNCEDPGGAFYGQQNSPTKNPCDDQVSDDCQKKFHGRMVAGEGEEASTVEQKVMKRTKG